MRREFQATVTTHEKANPIAEEVACAISAPTKSSAPATAGGDPGPKPDVSSRARKRIVLRLLVCAYVGYFNNDNHLAVIEYVSRLWLPPRAAQFDQAYHPPLYYFLAAPLFHFGSLPA